MPAFRNRSVFEIARGIKAFLNLEAGVTRSEAPGLGQVRRELAGKNREPAKLRTKPARKDGARAGGIKAENVVWIFGFGRSGSTWLSSMMGEMEDHTVWSEPLIGRLFGHFYYEAVNEATRKSPGFILGPKRKNWLGPMRSFFLEAASIRFPKVGDTGTLVVKEPHGSLGAPLLMEALPESRMILLIRDPRDVMASVSDSVKEGSWGPKGHSVESLPAFNLAWWANLYLQSLSNAKRAYEAHEGRKALIRYEDLRADTLGIMRRVYSALEIPVDEKELARVVEKHSWENIPEDEKGQGKFYRKAVLGGWKEDLTAEQVEMVENITAPILEEFYT